MCYNDLPMKCVLCNKNNSNNNNNNNNTKDDVYAIVRVHLVEAGSFDKCRTAADDRHSALTRSPWTMSQNWSLTKWFGWDWPMTLSTTLTHASDDDDDDDDDDEWKTLNCWNCVIVHLVIDTGAERNSSAWHWVVVTQSISQTSCNCSLCSE